MFLLAILKFLSHELIFVSLFILVFHSQPIQQHSFQDIFLLMQIQSRHFYLF